ncbi:hypothetical protein BLA29_010065, partial [Euroglyphus maynei]
MPSKRIYGLQKVYKKQFEKKFDKNAILSNDFSSSTLADDHNLQFHRNHIDWQLVFATISGFPYCRQSNTTLARQLDFDSLFDIEDAITQSAYLLANARQHSQLIDNLVLNKDEMMNNNNNAIGKNNYKQPTTQYDLAIKDDYDDDFTRLINMIEKLVKIKNEQMNECLMVIGEHRKEESSLLDAWLFFRRKSRNDYNETDKYNNDVSQVKNLIENLRKEINSWEELIDVINI